MGSESEQGDPTRLWNRAFLALTATAAFGFCNIALFYSLNSYLTRIGIDPAWRGMVIAAEPLTAFACRPFLSLLLTPANALTAMRLSLVANGLALVCYPFALSLPALFTVRIFHGLAFVVLVSAITARITSAMPHTRSAGGYAIFSLSSLLPFALMPPLVEALLRAGLSEVRVYAWAAVLVLPSLALTMLIEPKREPDATRPLFVRPKLGEIFAGLRGQGAAALLAANLCLFVCSTMVFFFSKDHAMGLGMANPDHFFVACTLATLCTRLFWRGPLERLSPTRLLAAFFLALAATLIVLGLAKGPLSFLVAAALYGACLGALQPLLNAAMHQASAPKLRATNLILMLFMMDGGYVAGPLLGGAILAHGFGYSALYLACAGFCLAGGLLVLPLALRR